MALLIAGGALDPNLDCLVGACRALGVPSFEVRHGPGSSPAFEWNLGLPIDLGRDWQSPSGAFIRHDVFEDLEGRRSEISNRAFAWYQAVHGWLLSEPGVRMFNKTASPVSGNKVATLVAARGAGLRIPHTMLTNREETIRAAAIRGDVTKPTAGGDYCYRLDEAVSRTEFRSGVAAAPAFVQPRLVSPEIRVYVVGALTFAFEMRSSSLDYRIHQDVDVLPLDDPPSIECSLRRLMESLEMNYGAADFKTDPESGELIFLELNSSPMVARFDREAGGKLCEAMVRELTGGIDSSDCKD